MPDTPTIQDSVEPRVTQAPDLPEAATPQVYGDAVGNALESAGEVATKIHHDAYQEANDAWTQGQYVALSKTADSLFYNAKSGLFNQQLGAQAIPQGDKALAAYDQQVAQLASQAQNPAQAQAFARMANDHRLQLGRQVGEYQHREYTGYVDAQSSAFIQQHLNGIAQTPGDDAAVAAHITAIQGAARLQAERHGIDAGSPAGQEALASITAHAQLTALSGRVAAGDDAGAAAYLQANRAGFDAKTLPEAERMVGDSSTAGQAQRMLHQFTLGPDGQPVSREEFLTRVNSDPTLAKNVRLYDAVSERGERFLSQSEAAKRQSQDDAFSKALGFAQEPGNTYGIGDPRIIPLRSQMSPVQWDALQARLNHDDNVETFPQNAAIAHQLRAMIADGKPHLGADGKPDGQPNGRQQFLALNGADYYAAMDPKTHAEFFGENGMQTGLRTGGVKDPGVAAMLTDKDIQEEGHSALGLPAEQSKWTPEQWKTANDFNANLAEQIERTEALTGKKLDPTARRQLMQQSLIAQVRVNGTLTPAFSVGATDAAHTSLARADVVTREGEPNAALLDRTFGDFVGKYRTTLTGSALVPSRIRPQTKDQVLGLSVAIASAKARGDDALAESLTQYGNHLLDVEQRFDASQGTSGRRGGQQYLPPGYVPPPTRGPAAAAAQRARGPQGDYRRVTRGPQTGKYIPGFAPPGTDPSEIAQ